MLLGATHRLLDVAGMLGGEIFDLLNAGLYALEGNKEQAKLCLLAAIPVAGILAVGVKGIRNATKLTKTAKIIDGIGDSASDVYKAEKKSGGIKDTLQNIFRKRKNNNVDWFYEVILNENKKQATDIFIGSSSYFSLKYFCLF